MWPLERASLKTGGETSGFQSVRSNQCPPISNPDVTELRKSDFFFPEPAEGDPLLD